MKLNANCIYVHIFIHLFETTTDKTIARLPLPLPYNIGAERMRAIGRTEQSIDDGEGDIPTLDRIYMRIAVLSETRRQCHMHTHICLAIAHK